MSSCDRRTLSSLWLAAGLLAALPGLQGCQVRPMYAASGHLAGKLDTVAVDPVKTRVAQQVRNHLIFLLHGGGAEPTAPTYDVSLSVLSTAKGVFINGGTNRARAGELKVAVTYTLRDARTGAVLRKATRSAVSAFDLPSQEFAKIRSTQDAENRAATAAAELVDADLAGYLSR